MVGRTGRSPVRVAVGAVAIGLLALTLGAGSAGAIGADEGLRGGGSGVEVTLEVEAGVDGLFLAGGTVPVTVTIESDRSIEGTLEAFVQTELDPQQFGFGQADAPGPLMAVEVEVPSAGSRRVDMTLGVSGGAADGTVRVRFLGDDDEDPLATARADLEADWDTELVAILHDGSSEPAGIESERFPAMSEERLAVFHAVATDRGDVPGFDAYHSVYSPDSVLAGLNEAWQQALISWVEHGGQLLVDGSYPTWLLDAITAASGTTAVALGLGSVRPAEGAMVAAVANSPVASWPDQRGLSSQVTLALWFDLGTLASRTSELAGFSQPDLGGIGMAVVIYLVVVGPLVFFATRRRRWLRWVVPPVLAVIGTGLVFSISDQLETVVDPAHISVVHLGPTQADQFSMVGVSDDWDLGDAVEFPPTWTPAAVSWIGPGGEPSSLEQRAERTAQGMVVEPTSDENFGSVAARGPIPTPGSIELTEIDVTWQRTRGKVTNSTELDLDNVVMWGPMGARKIGDLDAGETESFVFDAEGSGGLIEAISLVGSGQFNNLGLPQFDVGGDVEEMAPLELLGLDLTYYRRYVSPNELVIIGWTNQLPTAATVGGRAVSTGRTLVVQHLSDTGVGYQSGRQIRPWGWVPGSDQGWNQFNFVNRGGIGPDPDSEPPGPVLRFDVGDVDAALELSGNHPVFRPPQFWVGDEFVDVEVDRIEQEREGFDGDPLTSYWVGAVPDAAINDGVVLVALPEFAPQSSELYLREVPDG